jgi:S-DNA-T family DNA segregation ATPase FtsK/SpoIIIE
MAKKEIELEDEFEDEEDEFEDDAPIRRSSSNRKKPGPKKGQKQKRKVELKDETRHSIWGISFFVIAIFSVLSIFKMGGIAGDFFKNVFLSFLGWGYYLLPIILGAVGISFMRKGRPEVATMHAIVGTTSVLSILGIADVFTNGSGESLDISIGGYLGSMVAWPFVKLFGVYASILMLVTILVISLIVLFDRRPNLVAVWEKIKALFKREIKLNNTVETTDEEDYEEPIEVPSKSKKVSTDDTEDEIEEETPTLKIRKFISKAYTPPPLSLLQNDRGKANVGDTKANLNTIQKTLLNFGIAVEMDEVTVGPTVTRYALKPAQGVKLSRIVGLQNDLALALAVHPIRIEAPIPGKSLVGIEIPNKSKSTVGMGTLLSDDKFQNAPKPLMVALGRGLSGKPTFGNLAKMPHALVAGTTGSGKSVTVHSIITSLLFRNGPEDLRFIMVDPKRVELTLYNKIPHLLTPVITDPKKTILALKWAAKEMDRRYDVLESHSVRDIESYHNTILKGKKDLERMPYIVIIIDELADIMQTYPKELESGIVRLAQMSRAVGIHLILSTQRPSVNVITGLIKANVPTRVALQVSSQIDSRTILDQGGAEKLLGAGDMLYMSGEMSQPERLQSAYISEEEVKSVVQYLKDSYMDELPDTIELSGSIEGGNNLFSGSLDEGGPADDLYEDARQIVIETGKASTSYLQRRLGIGYARAAKLIDMLEERGIVGPANGAKGRDVLERSVDNIGDDIAPKQEKDEDTY